MLQQGDKMPDTDCVREYWDLMELIQANMSPEMKDMFDKIDQLNRLLDTLQKIDIPIPDYTEITCNVRKISQDVEALYTND